MNLVLHWPQITMLLLMGIGLLGAAAFDGKPRTEIKFGVHLMRTVIIAWLLWCGGFFG